MNAIPHYNPGLPALPDSICIDAYDETEAVWIPSIMVSYLEYNAAGRVVSNVINMNMMGLPLPMMMETCSYDAQNRITGLAMFFADPEGPVYWVPSYRFILSIRAARPLRFMAGKTMASLAGWPTISTPLSL
jgi:hypothetical protein